MFNVDRTKVNAPASLQKRKKYDEEDVYEALKTIFFEKCYLCETKRPLSINIEHLDAHQGDQDKKYDWNNLYYVCARCNNIKLANYNTILDCCDNQTDVFKAIKFSLPMSPRAKRVNIEEMNNDPKTIETTELLKEIFNNNNTVNKHITAAYLRELVFERYNTLLTEMNKYFDKDASETQKADSIGKMKEMIKRDKPYSAFVRWCILEDQELAPLLEQFMD